MDELFLRTNDAARVLKRSVQTVRNYERDGRLRAIRTADGTRLFREADVRRLADELEPRAAAVTP